MGSIPTCKSVDGDAADGDSELGSIPTCKSVDGDAADGDAPGLARLEQLVGVDLVQPADEVPFLVVCRAAVHGGVRGRCFFVHDAALELLRSALRFLGRRPFHVAAWHGRRVLWRPCRVRSPSATYASATAPSTH